MVNQTSDSSPDDGGRDLEEVGDSARITKTDAKKSVIGETMVKLTDTKRTIHEKIDTVNEKTKHTMESMNEKIKVVEENVKTTLGDKRPGKKILGVGHMPLVEIIFVITLSLCMAFSAGYSNGVALSGFVYGHTSMAVAGVTNLYTTSAIDLGESDIEGFTFDISIIFCSMAGSCLSAVINPRPVAFVFSPRYGPTFLIGCLFSVLAAFSRFNNSRREFYFMAIANGLMNGVTSMYSANLLRTTSYTGPTTDIGVYFGQVIRGNNSNLWRLKILSGLTTFFWIGGLVGYHITVLKRQSALIFNACFFGCIGFSVIFYFMQQKKLSFCEAVLGVGKVGITFEKVSVRRRPIEADGEEDGGEKVRPSELMALYDEILEREGKVDQDALMNMLASRDLEVKKYRRPLCGIIYMRFSDDREGDWTLSREDWENLVEKSERSSMRQPTSIPKNKSRARSSIVALKLASMEQLESNGYIRVDKEN